MSSRRPGCHAWADCRRCALHRAAYTAASIASHKGRADRAARKKSPLRATSWPSSAMSFPVVARNHWEKGDSPHLCEAPFGPFRQMGTVPFSQTIGCLPRLLLRSVPARRGVARSDLRSARIPAWQRHRHRLSNQSEDPRQALGAASGPRAAGPGDRPAGDDRSARAADFRAAYCNAAGPPAADASARRWRRRHARPRRSDPAGSDRRSRHDARAVPRWQRPASARSPPVCWFCGRHS